MRRSVLPLLLFLGVLSVVHATTTINLVYLHGVQSCTADRQSAHNRLLDLKNSLQTALANNPAYSFTHTLVNLYTEPQSSCVPSNSKGPMYMDDWTIGNGCGSQVSGNPGTTAYEWRYRLANKLKTLSGNIVLIGHSTGARVAVEVAANVGPGGQPQSYNWGVQDKILGVATVNGMIADLNNPKFNLVGPTSFLLACQKGDFLFIGPSCANGNGWCEYGGLDSGVAANDWLALNKQVLNLVSYASCSPDMWNGLSDGALSYDAQSSPYAPGLDMTTVEDDVYTPTNGVKYGDFCHSAITTASYANHGEAVSAATARIKSWLLVSAPKVVRTGYAAINPVNYMWSSPSYNIPAGCPAGYVDGSIAVAGVCSHPGWFDGSDHAINQSEFTVTDGKVCDGSFRWAQLHDSDNAHAATVYYKSHANLVGGVASKAK